MYSAPIDQKTSQHDGQSTPFNEMKQKETGKDHSGEHISTNIRQNSPSGNGPNAADQKSAPNDEGQGVPVGGEQRVGEGKQPTLVNEAKVISEEHSAVGVGQAPAADKKPIPPVEQTALHTESTSAAPVENDPIESEIDPPCDKAAPTANDEDEVAMNDEPDIISNNKANEEKETSNTAADLPVDEEADTTRSDRADSPEDDEEVAEINNEEDEAPSNDGNSPADEEELTIVDDEAGSPVDDEGTNTDGDKADFPMEDDDDSDKKYENIRFEDVKAPPGEDWGGLTMSMF